MLAFLEPWILPSSIDMLILEGHKITDQVTLVPRLQHQGKTPWWGLWTLTDFLLNPEDP